MIRVVVADDHGVVRAGLAGLLSAEEDIEVAGTAASGTEAVEVCERVRPDIVLMDLSMPDVDGVEATRRITTGGGAMRVLVLTSFVDRDRITAALEAGATGYLLKDSEPADLLRGVRAAARGEAPLDPKAAAALLARQPVDESPELTQREREVLGLVAIGLTNKLIARRLSISEKTVKAHLTSAFRRIGVDDRTQAALWAQRHGLGGSGAV
jgi:DNA-binding NarL/FixJ family response regulator